MPEHPVTAVARQLDCTPERAHEIIETVIYAMADICPFCGRPARIIDGELSSGVRIKSIWHTKPYCTVNLWISSLKPEDAMKRFNTRFVPALPPVTQSGEELE